MNKISTFFSFLFLTFCYTFFICYITIIPLFYSLYYQEIFFSPNTEISPFNSSQLKIAQQNLVHFYWYKEELVEIFDQREQIHYVEIREILKTIDIIAVLLLFSLALYCLKFEMNKQIISKVARYNIISLFLFSIVLLLFFNFFWNTIFHPLLFSNDFWIMYSNQISYYLFPQEKFFNVLLYCVCIQVLISTILIIIARRKND